MLTFPQKKTLPSNSNTLLAFAVSSFNDTVQVVLALAAADLITAEQIANKTVEDVQTAINSCDLKPAQKLGKVIHAVGTKLNAEKFNGNVPCNAADLKALKLDETVIGLLLNHVFGDSDLVIGLNTRKLMVALDLYDWEDSSAEMRVDVKMVKIPSNYIKASLLTWLPTGEKRNFQELLEPLATAVGEHKCGFWGKLTSSLKRHFSPKDKDALVKMSEKIHQLQKSTRVGVAQKLRLCT